MSNLGVTNGEKLLLKIGDGGTPEVFAHPCLINTDRSVDFTSELAEAAIPDCVDPSRPAQKVYRVKSVDFAMSGAGKLNKADAYAYLAWWQSGAVKNAVIVFDETGANGGWTLTVPVVLKSYKQGGARGDYQDCDIAFAPAGAATLTQNA